MKKRRVKIKSNITSIIRNGLKERDLSYVKCIGSFSDKVDLPMAVVEIINAARDDVEDMLRVGYDFYTQESHILRSKVLTMTIGVYALNDEECQSICEEIESIIGETILSRSIEIDDFSFRTRIFDDITQPEIMDSGSQKLFYSSIPAEINLRYIEIN